MWPASLLLFQQPDHNIARSHALDPFESGEAFKGLAILVEDAGQGAGVFRIGKDRKERGHVGLGGFEAKAAVQLADADPGNGN